MDTVKIRLLRPEPELIGSDGENLLRLERQKSVVLRIFMLAVLRVLKGERIDSKEMLSFIYGDLERNPNNIEQSLTKVFNPLRNTEADLRGKTSEQIIREVWVDIREFGTLAQTFTNTPPEGVLAIEQSALQIVSLYGSGLLPSWNDAWIGDYRKALETKYCNFLNTLAHLLLEAKQVTMLERIVYRAMEYHTDPDREEKKTLDKIIEQINTQPPKQDEK